MKILLLDGMNLIHRARSGWMKGPHPITFNFFRNLKPILEKFGPDLAYFALEGRPAHRTELLPEYKGTRKKQPDSFWRQKDEILSILSSLPVIQVRHPNLECDDVIANLARSHVDRGDEVVIVSNDSDFIQVFDSMDSSQVSIYNPMKKIFVDPPEYNYLQWKSLRGDGSDNITGIKGVGNKTAEKLVMDSAKLDAFLSDPDKSQIYHRNMQLIGFQWLDDLNVLEYRAPSPCLQTVKETFDQMGFTSMVKETYWLKFQNSFSTLI